MTTYGGYGDVEGDDVGRRISQHDIEAILGGGLPRDPSLDALASLIQSVHLTATIPDEVAALHVAAAVSAAANAARAAGRPATVPTRHRRLWFRGALSGLTAKILLGTAAALAATGGAAATGILPGAVQDVLSDGASHIGIEIPHSHEPGTTTTTVAVTTTVVVATTEPTTTGSTTTTVGWAAFAGSHSWASTSCSGEPIAVGYTVSGEGELELGVITGGTAIVRTDHDRIEVRFTDGVRIRLMTQTGGDGPGIDESQSRDCGGGDDSGQVNGDESGQGGTDTSGQGDGDEVDGDDHSGTGSSGDDTSGSGGSTGVDHSGSDGDESGSGESGGGNAGD